MYIEVDFPMFVDAFKKMGRDYFTYEGYKVLYNYLTECENDLGIKIELDIIAICCEYHEYKAEDLILEYGAPSQTPQEVLEYVRNNTTVLEVPQPDGSTTYIVEAF
ncbi:MAG: hypothetical protein QXT77_09740 [Candidatus Methanomethylicaceae archaeon]